MHKVPHRVIVDLQAASGQLGNKPAYREIAVLDPVRQPDRVLPGNRLRLMTTHLARRNAARKVMVFQRPCETLAVSLCPRGAHPRKGAISVRVQVSSMKTSRSASTWP